MAKTNLLVFYNEMKLSSDLLAKTLNQSHEKFFSSGSISRGTVTPISGLIGTSNDEVLHERFFILFLISIFLVFFSQKVNDKLLLKSIR